MDNLYVVTGTDVQKRNAEVIQLIQGFKIPNMTVTTFAQQDLLRGREGAIDFYNTFESVLTSKSIPTRRGDQITVVINCADEFAKLVSYHYRMMSYAVIIAMAHSNVGLRIILAVEDDFGLDKENYVRRLFLQ